MLPYIINLLKRSCCYEYKPKNIKENIKISENKKGCFKFMCKASEIGKIIVNKCLQNGIEINTQKLQKLLVLVQIECIKDSGFPLFSEDIRIWDCGVAIKEVDEDFRQFGTQFTTEFNENIVLLDSEMQYIDNIINTYGSLTASQLNALPINQKVISMGIKHENETYAHVTAERMTEEFKNDKANRLLKTFKTKNH